MFHLALTLAWTALIILCVALVGYVLMQWGFPPEGVGYVALPLGCVAAFFLMKGALGYLLRKQEQERRTPRK